MSDATSRWWYRPFHMPLRSTINVQGVESNQRSGFFLFCEEKDGAMGVGEISPLPGLHVETRDKVECECREVVELLSQGTSHDLESDWTKADALAQRHHWSSSVQFGIEMALANLHASRQQRPWNQLIDAEVPTTTPLQGLLWGNITTLVKQLCVQQDAGYRSFKLKVARPGIDVTADIATFEALLPHLHPETMLRLDANRGWTPKQASAFVEAVDTSRIDYIEEPVRCIETLATWSRHSGCPIALDESLDELAFEDPRWESLCTQAKALVLKPQWLGGQRALRSWYQRGQKYHCQCVVSSCFETTIGLSYLAQWSSLLAPHAAAGLDTLRWFNNHSDETASLGTIHHDVKQMESHIFAKHWQYEEKD